MQKCKVIMNRSECEDDRLIANGTMPEEEYNWLLERKDLAHSDYGQQDTLVSVSCYADNP